MDDYRKSVAVEEVNGLINEETLVEADKLGKQAAADNAETPVATDMAADQGSEENEADTAESTTYDRPTRGYESGYEEPTREQGSGLAADGVARSAYIL